MATGIIAGNVFAAGVVSITLDPASIGAATTSSQVFTVPGVRVGDVVTVNAPVALNAGLGVVNAFVTAADTVSVRFINATAGAIDPAAGTYLFYVTRPESVHVSFSP